MKDNFRFDNDYDEGLDISSEDSFSKITSYSISYNVATLLDLIEHQELELEPEFQRNFVWNKQMASLFIDSLLIGFPTPNLFFGRNSQREDFIVIDGLQRLKTIYFFITGNFSSGDISSQFRLEGLEGRSWNGCSFNELPLNLQRRLRNTIQNATVIDDIDFNPEIVHELFFRINTGGIPLTNQEVRNCVYIGPFNRTLHEINLNDDWRKILGTKKPHARLADIELILRILSLIENNENYRPPMHKFLSYFQSEHREHDMHHLLILFAEICHVIVSNFQSNAFRKKNIVKRSLLETVFTALGILIKENYPIKDLEKNIEKIDNIFSNQAIFGSANSSSAVVREKIQIALNVFRGENEF
ncbi:DUF262 domain-containing protein [Vibrio vulnificus]|uniref:DUF262 domain-containing protein n=1 Tax=Vibrio vulnificus TaxID=672 RepID=UPI003ED94332